MKFGRYANSMFVSLAISILMIAPFPPIGGIALCLCFVIAMLYDPYDKETKKDFEELPY